MNNYSFEIETVNQEIGVLFNYKYGIKITIYNGVNTISSENFLSLPDFYYLNDFPLILFKINFFSYEKASLRSYDNFPLLIKIRNPKEELFIHKSGICMLNNIENLEIKVLPTKKIDFGSFVFQTNNNLNNKSYFEYPSSQSGQIDIKSRSIEVIDLTSANEQVKQENSDQNITVQKFSQNEKELNENVIFNEDYTLLIILKKNLECQFLNFLKKEQIKLENEKFESSNRISQRILGKRNRDLFPDSNQITSSYNKIDKNKKKSYIEKNKNITQINSIKTWLNDESLLNDKNRKEKNKDCLSDSNMCMICIDKIKLPSQVTGCGHLFCKVCIDKWTHVSNSCPLCKKDYKKIIYYNQGKTKITKQRNVKKRLFKVEEDIEDSYTDNTLEHCMKCKGTSDLYVMLVCDKCKFNICHTYCAGLDKIPDEEWICFECSKPRENKSKRKRNVDIQISKSGEFSKSNIKTEFSPTKINLRSKSKN